MSIKRVFEGGSKPPAKHRYNLRSKSKCDRFDFKTFDLRFPHLTSKILSELNPKSLVTFSKVDRFLCENIESQRIYWIRRIQSKSNKFDEFKKEWASVLKKISMKTLMLLETALCLFESENADQYSPLHIAAKFGFELFMEIESKFKDKNPSNSNGDTPLHFAVGNGHLEICQWIGKNIDNLNIADRNGLTPLHIAALVDDLKIYQLIATNVENKSPENNLGITPLQFAQAMGCNNVTKFIYEEMGVKPKIITLSLLKQLTIHNAWFTIRQYQLPLIEYAISKAKINPDSWESVEAQVNAREFIESTKVGQEKLQKLAKKIDPTW